MNRFLCPIKLLALYRQPLSLFDIPLFYAILNYHFTKPFETLTLMLDPDEAGIKATKEIVERLINKLYIKVIDLKAEGLEPDSLLEEKKREMFS